VPCQHDRSADSPCANAAWCYEWVCCFVACCPVLRCWMMIGRIFLNFPDDIVPEPGCDSYPEVATPNPGRLDGSGRGRARCCGDWWLLVTLCGESHASLPRPFSCHVPSRVARRSINVSGRLCHSWVSDHCLAWSWGRSEQFVRMWSRIMQSKGRRADWSLTVLTSAR